MGGISGVGEHYNNTDLTITIILAHCTYSCTQKSDHYTVRTTNKKRKNIDCILQFQNASCSLWSRFCKGKRVKTDARFLVTFLLFPLRPGILQISATSSQLKSPHFDLTTQNTNAPWFNANKYFLSLLATLNVCVRLKSFVGIWSYLVLICHFEKSSKMIKVDEIGFERLPSPCCAVSRWSPVYVVRIS